MKMKPVRLVAATLASVVLVAACDDPTGTVLAPVVPETELAVHLTTPFSDDGAILITLHGLPDEPVAVTIMDASLVVHTARIADTLRIAAFGSITSGPLLQIGPLRGGTASRLGASIDDAASQTNEQRELTGYSVTLEGR